MANTETADRSFTDSRGDVWVLRVSFGDRVALQSVCGFDFLKTFETRFQELSSILGDLARLAGGLTVLAHEQIVGRGLTEQQFFERLDGPTIEAAGEAFARAVVDFFPDPQRSIGHAALDKGIGTLPKMAEKAIAAIAAIPDESLLAQLNGGSGG